MKKTISLFLAIVMVLCSFAFCFAGGSTEPLMTIAANKSFSDVKGLACENAVNELSSLGIINGYKDGSFKPSGSISRAEMVKLIITAMEISPEEAGTLSFGDVSAKSWAAPYIYFAVQKGIINGYSKTSFGPNDTVTYDQAIAMITRALGYKDKELTGGYPDGCISKANELGLLKGVTAGLLPANRGDMAVLVYNSLEMLKAAVETAKPEETSKDDSEGQSGENTGDDTIYVGSNAGDALVLISDYAFLSSDDDDDDLYEFTGVNSGKSVAFKLGSKKIFSAFGLDENGDGYADANESFYSFKTEASAAKSIYRLSSEKYKKTELTIAGTEKEKTELKTLNGYKTFVNLDKSMSIVSDDAVVYKWEKNQWKPAKLTDLAGLKASSEKKLVLLDMGKADKQDGVNDVVLICPNDMLICESE